jgi:hypothetical protein
MNTLYRAAMKDGLTIIDGNKSWYLNDRLHRDDGPAVEYDNCYKSWWQHGQLHRADGPAIEYADGTTKYWYYKGKQIFCSTQQEFDKLIKLKAFW